MGGVIPPGCPYLSPLLPLLKTYRVLPLRVLFAVITSPCLLFADMELGFPKVPGNFLLIAQPFVVVIPRLLFFFSSYTI